MTWMILVASILGNIYIYMCYLCVLCVIIVSNVHKVHRWFYLQLCTWICQPTRHYNWIFPNWSWDKRSKVCGEWSMWPGPLHTPALSWMSMWLWKMNMSYEINSFWWIVTLFAISCFERLIVYLFSAVYFDCLSCLFGTLVRRSDPVFPLVISCNLLVENSPFTFDCSIYI